MNESRIQQQAAGRSAVTIRVGASSTTTPTMDTSSSGSSAGPAVQTVTSPPVPAHPAAAADTGRHSNASQQPEDDKRSAVNITHTLIVSHARRGYGDH